MKGRVRLARGNLLFGYLLRVLTPRGYSLKVKQHQSTSLLALYLRNPKMKLPKRFNRAGTAFICQANSQSTVQKGCSALSAGGWKEKNVGQSEFQASVTTLK